ncbi:MAG: hypothetical protein WCR02_10380 [Sphaerochaetaceae bacterium]
MEEKQYKPVLASNYFDNMVIHWKPGKGRPYYQDGEWRMVVKKRERNDYLLKLDEILDDVGGQVDTFIHSVKPENREQAKNLQDELLATVSSILKTPPCLLPSQDEALVYKIGIQDQLIELLWKATEYLRDKYQRLVG